MSFYKFIEYYLLNIIHHIFDIIYCILFIVPGIY